MHIPCIFLFAICRAFFVCRALFTIYRALFPIHKTRFTVIGPNIQLSFQIYRVLLFLHWRLHNRCGGLFTKKKKYPTTAIAISCICGVTHSCVTWLICVWMYMTLVCECTWHDSFVCELIHVWHDTFVCELIHVWHDSFVCELIHAWHDTFVCECTGLDVPSMTFMCVTWLICVWHDSFLCVTWLICMCDMTDSYVRHDSHTLVQHTPSLVCVWMHIDGVHPHTNLHAHVHPHTNLHPLVHGWSTSTCTWMDVHSLYVDGVHVDRWSISACTWMDVHGWMYMVCVWMVCI